MTVAGRYYRTSLSKQITMAAGTEAEAVEDEEQRVLVAIFVHIYIFNEFLLF